MYKKIFILIFVLMFFPIISSMQSGLNYYDSFENSLTISSPNATYQFAFLIDDIGDNKNNPQIADIDNDGINELIISEYSGKIQIWNWSGMKIGVRENVDGTDRGTYNEAGTEKMLEIEVDNDGDGYLEMVIADNNGYMRVLEYDGSSVTQIYAEPSDRGNYWTSPVFCDIDSDGDYDVFACSYNPGTCRLYIYDSGTYSLNFTHAPASTSFYKDNSPTCADYDNDGDMDLGVFSYEGYLLLYNWSNNAMSYINSYGDYGTSYSSPRVGNFLGDGLNYTIVCDSGGTCRALNCTSNLNGCSLLDISNDLGSFYYGSDQFYKITIGSKDYLLGTEAFGRLSLVELEDASTLTITQKGLDINGRTYGRIGLASNGTMDHAYILRNTQYDSYFVSEKYFGNKEWKTMQVSSHVPARYFGTVYYNGFYSSSGWTCGQLDHSTPEDECVIIGDEGDFYIYTLQNITTYRNDDIYSDYELAFLDVMPRDATQYLIGDKTYCVNEKRNILRGALGGGKIETWANVYDDEGSAVSNSIRITDGILSTYEDSLNYQNGIDLVSYDAGTDQWFEMNLSKPVQLGQLQWWGYWAGDYDPLNLRIQISDTSCDSPNFITIYNESNLDITGMASPEGIKIRFIPKNVQCIRITSSGAWYNLGTYTTTNFIAELAGYYANNCTYYVSPINVLNATIGEDYNVSMSIYPNDYRDSPNQLDFDYEPPYQDSSSNSMNVIDRMIIWVNQYT